jgi:hypothetical protein
MEGILVEVGMGVRDSGVEPDSVVEDSGAVD